MKGLKKYLTALFCAALLITMTACSAQPENNPGSSSSAGLEEPSQIENTSSAEELSQTEDVSSASSAVDSVQSDTASSAEAGSGISSSESDTQQGEDLQQESEVLVVYFSATGNTEAAAQTIADMLGADLYEIVPAEPYTDADLNWNDPDSRVNAEHEDSSVRPAIEGELPDLSEYDTIFIGYPLWWRQAPPIVWNFVESVDMAGKTVIPFCTSMSDGIGTSGDTLAGMAPDATWLAGQRFGERLDAAAVEAWLSELGFSAD